MRRSGFTFVEVSVAVAIGAFVTVVAVGALKSVSDSTQRVRDHSQMAAEMRYMTDQLRRDLENLYHDAKPEFTRLTGGPQGIGDNAPTSLTFYTVMHEKARAAEAEADVYEVEYRLMQDADKTLFTRRVWPNPDKDRDPGGLLTVLSTRIIDFNVRFYDGEDWVETWDEEEMREFPELIEVQLVGYWDDKHRPMVKDVFMNIAKGSGDGFDMETGGGGEGLEAGAF